MLESSKEFFFNRLFSLSSRLKNLHLLFLMNIFLGPHGLHPFCWVFLSAYKHAIILHKLKHLTFIPHVICPQLPISALLYSRFLQRSCIDLHSLLPSTLLPLAATHWHCFSQWQWPSLLFQWSTQQHFTSGHSFPPELTPPWLPGPHPLLRFLFPGYCFSVPFAGVIFRSLSHLRSFSGGFTLCQT